VLITTVVLVVISLVFARAIARPMHSITLKAEAIARGEPATDFVPRGFTPKEVQTLSQALDVMTRKLRAQAEYVSDFATTVSHELKTPIAAIRGAAELLLDWDRMDADQRTRFLRNIDQDAERMQRLVTRLLERWGAEFDLVDSGTKALEQLQQHDYDLVLMDTELESGSSRATRAIRELASDEPAPLPIIALGPNSAPGQHERLAGQGFTDFVDEPLESELLFRSIVRHASLHRALRGEAEHGHRRRTPGRC
jgi:CheY-like chemotaxis protein